MADNNIKGTTRTGFKFSIDKNELDSWELIEDIYDCDNGKPFKIVSVMRRILGVEQLDALKKHLSKDGEQRIPAQTMREQLDDILAADNKDEELKN